MSNCSLELGMFTNRLPGLDTIATGTNLSGLHSPLNGSATARSLVRGASSKPSWDGSATEPTLSTSCRKPHPQAGFGRPPLANPCQ